VPSCLRLDLLTAVFKGLDFSILVKRMCTGAGDVFLTRCIDCYLMLDNGRLLTAGNSHLCRGIAHHIRLAHFTEPTALEPLWEM
jgi:hypothetical protein